MLISDLDTSLRQQELLLYRADNAICLNRILSRQIITYLVFFFFAIHGNVATVHCCHSVSGRFIQLALPCGGTYQCRINVLAKSRLVVSFLTFYKTRNLLQFFLCSLVSAREAER